MPFSRGGVKLALLHIEIGSLGQEMREYSRKTITSYSMSDESIFEGNVDVALLMVVVCL